MNRKPLNAPTRAFRTGEVIFREGDPPADEAFMIHIGRVEVRKQVGAEERLLRVLVKGELLGELGLFGNSPRSATAQAETDAELLILGRDSLQALTETNPSAAAAFFHAMVHVFMERLRRSTQQVAEATRWGLEATGLDVQTR